MPELGLGAVRDRVGLIGPAGGGIGREKQRPRRFDRRLGRLRRRRRRSAQRLGRRIRQRRGARDVEIVGHPLQQAREVVRHLAHAGAELEDEAARPRRQRLYRRTRRQRRRHLGKGLVDDILRPLEACGQQSVGGGVDARKARRQPAAAFEREIAEQKIERQQIVAPQQSHGEFRQRQRRLCGNSGGGQHAPARCRARFGHEVEPRRSAERQRRCRGGAGERRGRLQQRRRAAARGHRATGRIDLEGGSAGGVADLERKTVPLQP